MVLMSMSRGPEMDLRTVPKAWLALEIHVVVEVDAVVEGFDGDRPEVTKLVDDWGEATQVRRRWRLDWCRCHRRCRGCR